MLDGIHSHEGIEQRSRNPAQPLVPRIERRFGNRELADAHAPTLWLRNPARQGKRANMSPDRPGPPDEKLPCSANSTMTLTRRTSARARDQARNFLPSFTRWDGALDRGSYPC